jgi:dihydroflavonol-4-reductase
MSAAKRLTLVTGGAGFIGSHLVRQLVERGHRVRVLDRQCVNLQHLPLDRIEIQFGDICNAVAVEKAVRDCEVVYHLAANPQLWTRRKGDFGRINYGGTKNVLQAAIAAGTNRILHCSTESILTRSRQSQPIDEDQHVPIDDVIGPYCRSKWLAERHAFHLAKAGAPVVIVNPTLPIGPGDWGRSPPTQMIFDCALGKRTAYLDAELNLIDVRDVATGMIAAVERGQPGRRYLLGAENWSIRQLFEWVAAQTGAHPPRFTVPYPIALTAAMASEWIADVFTSQIPAASVTGVRLTRRTMRFDSSRSLSELGLQTRPVTQSLSDALSWFRSIGWIK